ncbi:hypothetical protein HG531_001297 [Fusarium graminearum]|nr:hypothetical protein HG531_001297 [Fusarium graminearum]
MRSHKSTCIFCALVVELSSKSAYVQLQRVDDWRAQVLDLLAPLYLVRLSAVAKANVIAHEAKEVPDKLSTTDSVPEQMIAVKQDIDGRALRDWCRVCRDI